MLWLSTFSALQMNSLELHTFNRRLFELHSMCAVDQIATFCDHSDGTHVDVILYGLKALRMAFEIEGR